jgi:tRNA (guanine-N7-)-methyltransferase
VSLPERAAEAGHPPKRKPGPYEDAPRLPAGVDYVDLRSVVSGGELELEIGPGPKAGFLCERALSAPESGLVGLEIRKKWAAVGDARLAKQGHAKRARVALPRLGPDASVARAYLHFPDPWWKKRHTKRLVMGDVFLAEVARLLVPNGELYVQTDVEERAELYERVVSAHEAFEPAGDVEGSARIAENPYGARSPREHRAIADGLPVHRMLWRRRT